jgi:hypothetical protein
MNKVVTGQLRKSLEPSTDLIKLGCNSYRCAGGTMYLNHSDSNLESYCPVCEVRHVVPKAYTEVIPHVSVLDEILKPIFDSVYVVCFKIPKFIFFFFRYLFWNFMIQFQDYEELLKNPEWVKWLEKIRKG